MLPNTDNEYVKQAEDFLKYCKAKLKIEFKRSGINKNWDDNLQRFIYKFTITNDKGQSYSDLFYDSNYNYENNIEPTSYDILACLTKYPPGTFKDFCCDYGYSDDSIKALKIYKAVKKEYAGISSIFTEEQMEKLREIE